MLEAKAELCVQRSWGFCSSLPGARIGHPRARIVGFLHAPHHQSPYSCQYGQVPGISETVKKGEQGKNPVGTEPSPGAATGGGPPFTSLIPRVWKNSPSHNRSQILPSTRKDGSSGGFQSISRRLTGRVFHKTAFLPSSACSATS